MQLVIQARHFDLTEAIRKHVEKRLGFLDRSHLSHVKQVLVRLSDINGPRGGDDKQCQINVHLPGEPSVVIEETRSDLYTAIDRATQRVSHAINRRLGKRKTRKRLRAHIARQQVHTGDDTVAAMSPCNDN